MDQRRQDFIGKVEENILVNHRAGNWRSENSWRTLREVGYQSERLYLQPCVSSHSCALPSHPSHAAASPHEIANSASKCKYDLCESFSCLVVMSSLCASLDHCHSILAMVVLCIYVCFTFPFLDQKHL